MINDLWTCMMEAWDEALRLMKECFREDGKTVNRTEDAPYMVLQEVFLKQARHFLEYIRWTVTAISTNKQGRVEEIVLQAAKWEFLLNHIIFSI